MTVSLNDCIEGILSEECANGAIDMININVENLSIKLSKAITAMGDESIRKDEMSKDILEPNKLPSSTQTLIDCELLDSIRQDYMDALAVINMGNLRPEDRVRSGIITRRLSQIDSLKACNKVAPSEIRDNCFPPAGFFETFARKIEALKPTYAGGYILKEQAVNILRYMFSCLKDCKERETKQESREPEAYTKARDEMLEGWRETEIEVGEMSISEVEKNLIKAMADAMFHCESKEFNPTVDEYAAAAFEEVRPYLKRELGNSWNSMNSAPRDGTNIIARTNRGAVFLIRWEDNIAVNENEEQIGSWVALFPESAPSCWTDGICWESNEDGEPSSMPIAWLPNPTESEVQS